MHRGALFCSLVAIGVANGVAEAAFTEIDRNGFALAALNTFGISAIVWAAAFAAGIVLLRARPRPVGKGDLAVALLAALAFLAPPPFLSWLGIALLGAHLCLSGASGGSTRRAGVVLLALTVPMLWARIVFAAASTTILEMDARLVGWIVGTGSAGNMVPLADGSGVIFLEPACSSITNLSLAVLCGVLFLNLRGARWSGVAFTTVALAGLVTIAINVTRIALIGLMPAYYAQIHGAVGATLAAWATIAAMLWIFDRGMRADAQAAI